MPVCQVQRLGGGIERKRVGSLPLAVLRKLPLLRPMCRLYRTLPAHLKDTICHADCGGTKVRGNSLIG